MPGTAPSPTARTADALPTLLLWGESDRLTPLIYGETYHKLIAGSKLVKFAGTGHMPMFEQPEKWSAAISQFLHQETVNA